MVETLNGWRDGILAIGTFGFDEIVVEGDKADAAEPTTGDDEAKTRGLLKAAAGFEHKKDDPVDVLGSKPQVGPVSLLQHPQAESTMEVEAKSEKKEERTRTTLADLFSRHDVQDEKPPESGGKKDAGGEDGRKKAARCVKPGEAAAKAAAVARSKGEDPGTSAKIQKVRSSLSSGLDRPIFYWNQDSSVYSVDRGLRLIISDLRKSGMLRNKLRVRP